MYLSTLFCAAFWADAPGLVAVLAMLRLGIRVGHRHVPCHRFASGPDHGKRVVIVIIFTAITVIVVNNSFVTGGVSCDFVMQN